MNIVHRVIPKSCLPHDRQECSWRRFASQIRAASRFIVPWVPTNTAGDFETDVGVLQMPPISFRPDLHCSPKVLAATDVQRQRRFTVRVCQIEDAKET